MISFAEVVKNYGDFTSAARFSQLPPGIAINNPGVSGAADARDIKEGLYQP